MTMIDRAVGILLLLASLTGNQHHVVVFSMPASPFPFEATNADGTTTGPLFVRGLPGRSYYQDSEGFTVCPRTVSPPDESKNQNRVQTWYYCQLDKDGKLQIRPDLQVGVANPYATDLEQGQVPSQEALFEQCGDFCLVGQDSPLLNSDRRLRSRRRLGTDHPRPRTKRQRQRQRRLPITTGTLRNLVVLFKFSNHKKRPLPSRKDFEIIMNSVGGHPILAPTGSVRDVFLDNSYGNLTIESVVAEWVTIDYSETYCTNNNSGLTPVIHNCLVNALEKVDRRVRFDEFDVDVDGLIDGITFLHSGYGAEWGGTDPDGATNVDRVWSHKWSLYTQNGGAGYISQESSVRVYNYHISPGLWATSGSEIGRIGVIAHETGHFLGLPDLYGGGWGLGGWSLMAYGSWGFDNSQLYPNQLDPWCKEAVGWATATEINSSATGLVLPPSYTSAANQYYKISLGYKPNEYLLLEYRKQVGFDLMIPQEGLLIYHIDNAAPFADPSWPGSEGFPTTHNRVALVQPDGLYQLEQWQNVGDAGDVFHAFGVTSLGPGEGGTVFPNTDSYQGTVLETGHVIEGISDAQAGTVMTFDFTTCINEFCNCDGICTGTETCQLCENECVFGPNTCCGDDTCDPGETSVNCPRDCFSPIYINAGPRTTDYQDSEGRIWKTDRNFNTGSTATREIPIADTADPILYHTERWDELAAPELQYSFNIPNGIYNVSLHFAELFFSTSASRVFNVSVQGAIAIPSLDIVSLLGPNTALVKSVLANVTDNELIIEFERQIENPKISAISIEEA